MLRFSRWFVLITGIIWTGYGIVAALHPEMIHQLTGIGIDNWPADVEVRAWYLVTELALGMLAYYGWREPEKYLGINLLIWAVVFTILVGFRFVGTWVNDGSFLLQPGAQHLPFSYHIGTAYLYELPSMLIFVFLWLRRGEFLFDTAPSRVAAR
jgi:hypothetical protein